MTISPRIIPVVVSAALLALIANAAVAAQTYEIAPLFQIKLDGESSAGIPAFRIDRVLSSSDSVRFSVRWGTDGFVYLTAHFLNYTGLKPTPARLQAEGVPPVARSYTGERVTYELTRSGKLMGSWKDNVRKLPPSSVQNPVPVSRSTLAWFKKNLGDLPEYVSKRSKATWRDGNTVVEHWDNPFFSGGSILGRDRAGDTVYLMSITTRKVRPHVHGMVDFFSRVYVIAPDHHVLFSAEAWPNIRLEPSTGNLYEAQLPAEGKRVLRIWKPKP